MRDSERAARGDPGAEELHASYLAALGDLLAKRELPAPILAALAQHATLVTLANRSLNLTRRVAPEEVARLQVLDSLAIAELLPLAGARVIDVGSGGGYPGIPMALIEPSASILLVDARRKKVDFLDSAVAALGLANAHPRWARIEKLLANPAAMGAARVDLLVARAVGRLAPLLALLSPQRWRFGRIALAKGPRVEEEIEAAGELLDGSRYRLEALERYEIGGGYSPRWVVFVVPCGLHRRKKGKGVWRPGRGEGGKEEGNRPSAPTPPK